MDIYLYLYYYLDAMCLHPHDRYSFYLLSVLAGYVLAES